MKENKRKDRDEDSEETTDTKKGKRVTEMESAAEHHSCDKQADSAQQSKHTAGSP